jgi:hypothetical protein
MGYGDFRSSGSFDGCYSAGSSTVPPLRASLTGWRLNTIELATTMTLRFVSYLVASCLGSDFWKILWRLNIAMCTLTNAFMLA